MIILIGSQKGGCGKTTLAINAAAWLVSHQKDVVLVDADYQGSAAKWVKDREQTQLPEVYCVQRYDDVRKTLLDLKSRYEYVVVDVAGHDSKELRIALLACDLFVVPFRPSQIDLDTLPHLNDMVDNAKPLNPRLKALSVIALASTNPVVKEIEEAREYIDDFEHFKMLEAIIYDRKIYRDVIGEGRGVFEAENEKAKNEIDVFMTELLNGD